MSAAPLGPLALLCPRCCVVRCSWSLCDPFCDPYLAVFGTPRLQWFVSCHYNFVQVEFSEFLQFSIPLSIYNLVLVLTQFVLK